MNSYDRRRRYRQLKKHYGQQATLLLAEARLLGIASICTGMRTVHIVQLPSWQEENLYNVMKALHAEQKLQKTQLETFRPPAKVAPPRSHNPSRIRL